MRFFLFFRFEALSTGKLSVGKLSTGKLSAGKLKPKAKTSHGGGLPISFRGGGPPPAPLPEICLFLSAPEHKNSQLGSWGGE